MEKLIFGRTKPDKQLILTNFPDDQALVEALRAGQESALDTLFRTHYAYLCQSVYRVLPDRNMAEDLVQEVFYELWRKRENLHIQQSVRAYLRRAAVNKTLNYIRDQRLLVEDEESMPLGVASTQPGAVQQMEVQELKEQMYAAIDALPERCRLVFVLSRFEHLSNKDIADQLTVSVKTVENQMTKALKILRSAMGDYLTVLFGFWELITNL